MQAFFYALLVVGGLMASGSHAAMPPSMAQLDADLGPVAGVRIRRVEPRTQAQALGLRQGEVFVSIDGQSVLHRHQMNSLRDTGADYRATLAATDGRKREVVFRPGLMGTWQEDLPPRLTLAVSRAMSRGGAWNDAMIAAAWALEQDKAQDAQRSLAAARGAGYPDDAVSRGLAFRVAAARGELKLVGEILDTLPARVDHQTELHLPGPEERYRYYLASGRGEELVRLLENEPQYFPAVQTTGWPRHAAILRTTPPRAEPSTGPVRLVNPMLFGAARWLWGGDLHTHDEPIVANRGFIIEQRPGTYKQAFLTRNDGFDDFELHARFTVALNGTPNSRYPSKLMINVSDYRAPAPEATSYFSGNTSLLGASFTGFEGGIFKRSVLHGWQDFEKLDASFFDGTTEHHLHISRRGAWGRIVLDGETLLDRPVDADIHQLVFHVHLVGLNADFNQFAITEPQPVR